MIEELAERILGRTTAEDVLHPITGEVLVERDELLDEEKVRLLDEAVVESVQVRSVLTCESRGGVCSMCYGRDLARGTPVNIGEAVGVIAAQSIGEPGTQLTMRTFHIGGAAQQQAERSSIEATVDGTMQLINGNLVVDSKQRRVVLGPDHRAGPARRDRAREGPPPACPSAPACWSSPRAGSRRASAWSSGTRTPCRSSPRRRGARCSWTWSRA